jgi:lipoate synthase
LSKPVVESEIIAPATPQRQRLPEWLRVNLPAGRAQQVFNVTQHAVAGNQLHTVCEEARCPNIHDCWARGTATFMVAGQSCTRGCRFCSVETLKTPAPPETDEPQRLAVRDPRASFKQSLDMLRHAKELRPELPTKSSLMVGVGETDDEIVDAMRQLRGVGVDLLTLGQYLAPGRPGTRFLPVDRYVEPRQFLEWEVAARAMGFKGVAAGPLVRSSYRAETLLEEALSGRRILPSAVQLHDLEVTAK